MQSADARVTLTIPAGALAGDTEIGVQQVSAESPGAVRAYRFTPDGITFTQPVTVRLQYDSAMVDGSAPELLLIATQLANGTWELLPESNVTLDTAAAAIEFQTTHFSDYTSLQGVQIRPPSATIDPGESVTLRVRNCVNIVEQSGSDHSGYAIDCDDADDLPPLPNYRVDGTTWAANGVQGGNTAVGFVAGVGGMAEYIAPQNPPAGNPVAVSVRVRDGSGPAVTTLVAHVQVRNTCSVNSGSARSAIRAECYPDRLQGTSRTTISDLTPVYKLDVDVTWDLVPGLSTPTSLTYRASGTAHFTAINTCISISPTNHSWNQGSTTSGGSLEVNLQDSTWTITGTSLWSATYQDTCEEESTPFEAAAGGAWVVASGTVDSTFDFNFVGTQSSSGQTFTFDFGPAGGTSLRGKRR